MVHGYAGSHAQHIIIRHTYCFSIAILRNNEKTGMPTNVAVFPKAVTEEAQVENNSFGNFASSGSLGQAFAPFDDRQDGLEQCLQAAL